MLVLALLVDVLVFFFPGFGGIICGGFGEHFVVALCAYSVSRNVNL